MYLLSSLLVPLVVLLPSSPFLPLSLLEKSAQPLLLSTTHSHYILSLIKLCRQIKSHLNITFFKEDFLMLLNWFGHCPLCFHSNLYFAYHNTCHIYCAFPFFHFLAPIRLSISLEKELFVCFASNVPVTS